MRNPEHMILEDTAINWIWYHMVEIDGDDCRVVRQWRAHRGEEEGHTETQGRLDWVSNSISPEFRKKIGLGDGLIACLVIDNKRRYVRWIT